MLPASHRRGLTHVELIVVVGIAAISIGLLLPAIQKVRANAGGRACANNLRILALAAHNYYDTNEVFPPGMDNQYVGALVRLLPYVEQDILYRNFSFDNQYSLYWQDPNNRPPTDGTDTVPPPPDGREVYGCELDVSVFLCPDGPRPEETVTALLALRYGNAGVDYRADDGLDNGHYFTGSPGCLVMGRSHYLGMAGDWRTDDPYNGKYRGIFRYNSHTRLTGSCAANFAFPCEQAYNAL